MNAVQQLAGHASAKMTLDTYSHVLEQDLGVKWIHIGFREDSSDNRCQTIYK